MILKFTREVIIVAGVPVIGTVTVAVDFELDPYDGLFGLDLYCTEFEPETPQALTWAAVEGPCEAWLAQNKVRAEKKALKR